MCIWCEGFVKFFFVDYGFDGKIVFKFFCNSDNVWRDVEMFIVECFVCLVDFGLNFICDKQCFFVLVKCL